MKKETAGLPRENGSYAPLSDALMSSMKEADGNSIKYRVLNYMAEPWGEQEKIQKTKEPFKKNAHYTTVSLPWSTAPGVGKIKRANLENKRELRKDLRFEGGDMRNGNRVHTKKEWESMRVMIEIENIEDGLQGLPKTSMGSQLPIHTSFRARSNLETGHHDEMGGKIIGGIAFVLFLVAFLVYCRYRARRRFFRNGSDGLGKDYDYRAVAAEYDELLGSEFMSDDFTNPDDDGSEEESIASIISDWSGQEGLSRIEMTRIMNNDDKLTLKEANG